MVTYIIGNYLIHKGYITEAQFSEILEEQKKVRVKLGLIAVAEGLMMQMEADEVNRLQAVMDKRFGDIAVEQGYLTEKEVDFLLMKQGNEYLSLAQTLENQKRMSLEQLEQHMLEYMEENDWGYSDIDDLKSNDINRILPLFLPSDSDRYLDLAGVAMRMIARRIDSNAYPLNGYWSEGFKVNHYAMQSVEGDKSFSCAIGGIEDELIIMAEKFINEPINELNEDVLDATAEIINCINGLYASSLSQSGMILELLPPEYAMSERTLSGEQMLVLPMVIQQKVINLVICMGLISDKRG